MANNSKPVRVMMWSTPRSVSTAIERSILTLDEAEVFNEMYSAAHHFGPTSNHFPLNYFPLSPKFSFKWVKSELEKDYPGKEVIFAKDFAYALGEDLSLLPTGYTHTILIRNPCSVLRSINHVIKNSYFLSLTGGSLKKHYPGTIFFKELWDLYVYARDTLHQNPVVIDADDFLENPEAMMKLYCEKTGIPFRDSMLSWEPTNIWSINWHSSYALSFAAWMLGYYGKALNSSGFRKADKPKEKVDMSTMDDDLREAVEENMEYYDMLYTNRLVLNME
ncbi:branched-chain-amino-acid aminotransferase-like protein 2 [Anneissia japonica]|uniref:branched-chain-amino-acid aminotransferase-like protein 2 n=1 Tax=Anneissia japonica TaxID=1529436 RepID=UPI0014255CD6|nr:branched-chain-amino-acid aminotransferase-like protein 2 [Anneissia japonica]